MNTCEGTLIETLQKILEKYADSSSNINKNALSDGENAAVLANNAKGTHKTASEILEIVSSTDSRLGAPRWNSLGNILQTFYYCRFTKESIFGVVAKLSKKYKFCSPTEQEKSLERLFDGIEWLVDRMIPPEEDQEITSAGQSSIYNKIATDISQGYHVNIVKWLSNIIFHHLKPTDEKIMSCFEDIETEIDTFSKMMWDWINQQIQQRKMKRDFASVAQEEMRKVLENMLAAIGPSVRRRGISSMSVEEGPAVIADETRIYAANTGEVTVYKVKELDDLCYSIVTQLVIRCLKDVNSHVSLDLITILVTLKEMLYTEIVSSDIDVKISNGQRKRVVESVYKDLRKEDKPGIIILNLQTTNQCFYNDVVMSVKRHLMKQTKKSSLMKFLNRGSRP